jgi:uncharacterized repeat protein (TIGR01451 family)
MNFKFYPLRALLLFLLLFGFKAGVQAQAVLDFVKTVENITNGGDGTTATQGEVLQYTITIRNLTATNFIASRLYDNVPAGVLYVANSTTLNGAAVADNAGKMPYSGSGAYVRSPTYGAGILAPNATATVIFRVQVTANGGSIFNNATIDATQNSVATIQATNTVFTNVIEDIGCNIVYQTTTYFPDETQGTTSQKEWSFLRQLNTTSGTGGNAGTQMFSGTAGPNTEALPKIGAKASIGSQIMDHCAAIAYDRGRQRIYFVNNTVGSDLCYVDLSVSPITARRFTGIKLDLDNGDNNYRINRMGMGSDGFGYALSSNGRDFVKFTFNATTDVPIITHMGALVNAATNGSSRNVLNESGGDLFADGSGKLYLITNASNMYKINPANRVATYMGSINFGGGSFTSQSLAIDAQGRVFIGGAYREAYRLDLQTMNTTHLNGNQNNVYESGDFTTCGFPVLASSIIADKTYHNINGSSTVNGGDTVEYVITVTNIGNINAAGVYMYDYIPPSTTYLAGTTTLNNIPVADAGAVMPYAVSGGRLVNTLNQDPGIVLPTAVNAAVVRFRVKTEPNKQVCNQSRITLLDADGNVMFVNSSDPTNVGQTPTCFYSDGVLPLTNLKFKGSLVDDKSVLSWTMNGDESVANYEIEYSENGTSFSAAGKVASKGNTNAANSYQFTDVEHAFSSKRFYRLKVNQKGGSYTYSGVIMLDLKDMDIQAVPNPFDKTINVQVRLKTAENVRIRLVDFTGREVYTTTEQLGIGGHSILIRIPTALPKGMYVLEVKTDTEQLFQKKLLKN